MMHVVLISGIAAAIHFAMALICLAFARAPGWRHYRIFSLVAFLMGIYASNDALVLHRREVSSWTSASATVNSAIALLIAGLWLVFTRRRDNADFNVFDKALLATLFPAAALALVPGVIVAGIGPPIEVPSLDAVYQTPSITPLGYAFFGLSLVAMSTIALRYLRLSWGGSASEKLGAFGFTLFVLMAVEEVLVASGILQWPYLADLGFAGISITFTVEFTARVSEDSRTLLDLNRTLEQRVAKRSEDLAETREALLVAERHAALGQLASGVGHEINNPLSYVHANLLFLRDYEGPHRWNDDEVEAIDEAIDGVQRIRRIVSDLTIASGTEPASSQVADVERAIRSAIRMASPRATPDVVFETDIVRCANAAIDESRLTQVLVNLLVNAAQARKDEGRHTVTIRCSTEDRQQIVEVIDTGTGIPASEIDRIFDPLFTTKAVGKGTGLGLFVCRGIVDEAGGQIRAESNEGIGTTIRVELPLTSRARTATMPPQAPSQDVAPSLASGLRIYILDDEVRLTRALRRMLSDAEVTTENDSRNALRHLRETPAYDVVLCDLMMPEMSGIELYEALEGLGSPLCGRFLFVTGGAVTSAADAFLEREDIQYLAKPLTPFPLRTAINTIAARERN